MTDASLIAPCGMNCGICMAYLRVRRRCPGCRGEDANKSVSVLKCAIRNCETVKASQSGFCFDCASYPCKRVKHLDKRYRTKYSMSMIENLEFIRDKGIAAFVEKENERWRCRACGGTINVHRGVCYECGKEPLR